MKRRSLSVAIFVLLMTAQFGFAENIKNPNVSGQFYEADPKKLADSIDFYLENADIAPLAEDVEMVIAPHAGYVYSGAVAGYSFKAIPQKNFKTIVILAPSHYFGFDGASVWPEGGFRTPLGVVPVDTEFAKQLMASDPKFYFERAAFDREHALEVEIPFLQRTFKDFKIVPVIQGQMSFESCQKLAAALNKLIGDRKDILVVVSSDMSHYHDDQTARKMDMGTLETIKSLDAGVLYKNCSRRIQEMCGFIPVTTAMLLAKERGLTPKVLRYAHSGDVSGDNSRVVGYPAVAFYKTGDLRPQTKDQKANGVAALNKEQKRKLIAIARQTIEYFVREKKVYDVKALEPRLSEAEGAFVTIHKHGDLRGCIGHVIAEGPLYKTVRDMAIAAASEDPRFPPVSAGELAEIDVEVSVLSRPWVVKDVSEIEMGKHGVIIGQGLRRGLFLPQVATETGWSKEKFLSELCSQKAGLKPECWKDPNTRIEIFTADVFAEKDLL